MGTGLSNPIARPADAPGHRLNGLVPADTVPAHSPPHAELPLIRAFVESLRQHLDEGDAEREAPAALRRTVETLAAILDLHGEFGAADEARAIVARLQGLL
jgi:hypothetical protein